MYLEIKDWKGMLSSHDGDKLLMVISESVPSMKLVWSNGKYE